MPKNKKSKKKQQPEPTSSDRVVIESDQPEASIKPMLGAEKTAGGVAYTPEPGEPKPDRVQTVRGPGLYAFQQHGGSKRACKGFNTVAVTTKSTKDGDSCKTITRYRKCNDCGVRYSHITILKKLGNGMWMESSVGFVSYDR